MKKTVFGALALLTFLTLISCSSMPMRGRQKAYFNSLNHREKQLYRKATRYLVTSEAGKGAVEVPPFSRLDSLSIDRKHHSAELYLNRRFTSRAYREADIKAFDAAMKKALGWRYSSWNVNLFADHYPITELVPNYFRSEFPIDSLRMASLPASGSPYPLVRNIDKPFTIADGLQNRHIALWHSHGWYYNNLQDRWEWERPRLWQTAEDLFPLSFSVPFLVPMLENAGAVVLLPRERDPQIHECVVDNDTPKQDGRYRIVNLTTETDSLPGFRALGRLDSENPFKLGTAVSFAAVPEESGHVEWTADIPEDGAYAVYVSYHQDSLNVRNARYTVAHAGGDSHYLVNQTMGGGTWIYLGTFDFKKDSPVSERQVILSNAADDSQRRISADAVRFGGGMGNVYRDGKVSRRSRFYEASRYWLQYAGMPDTLVYSFHADTLDYNDDYKCRGEWVNYLIGGPDAPKNGLPENEGLHVPVDLSLAFHTDAGITHDESEIGTLAIYNNMGMDTTLNYPDGRPRIMARDYADLLQTQIVEDLRQNWDPKWPRRSLMNSYYSESSRPNTPAMILELLSHQNFQDMKFGLDPQFRFDVSRAIYKSMLRFLSFQNKVPYVVQPLPVDHLSTELTEEGGIRLAWRAVNDALEPTAVPDRYLVYTRFENGEFDEGTLVTGNEYLLRQAKPGTIYSFKVIAVNAGGESFPSEVVSACRGNAMQDTALIISAFDRISAPDWVNRKEYAGFVNLRDEGVPYMTDYSFTGVQYDFDPKSSWKTNDMSGFGGSFSKYETTAIAGNRFDYPVIHGDALRSAGYAFVTVSDECIEDSLVSADSYSMIDVIGGEEKTTPRPASSMEKSLGSRFTLFTPGLSHWLENALSNGKMLFVSGAYIASDPYLYGAAEDTCGRDFARDFLKIKLLRTQASTTPGIFSNDTLLCPYEENLAYNADFRADLYKVESPDEIGTADSTARVILRFSENQFGCGIAAKTADYSAVSFSVPFESIPSRQQRQDLMKGILRILKEPLPQPVIEEIAEPVLEPISE